MSASGAALNPSGRDYERAIEAVRQRYPEDVFTVEGATPDAIAARIVRLACDQIENQAHIEAGIRFESRNFHKAVGS